MCTAKPTVATLCLTGALLAVTNVIIAEAVIACDTGITMLGAPELVTFTAFLRVCLTSNRATLITGLRMRIAIIIATIRTVCKMGVTVELSTRATLLTTQIARNRITCLTDFTMTSTHW
jgi:hypothetical protein